VKSLSKKIYVDIFINESYIFIYLNLDKKNIYKLNLKSVFNTYLTLVINAL